MIAYGMLYTTAVGIPVALAAVAITIVFRRHGRPERLVWLGGFATSLGLPVLALLDPFGGGDVPPLLETGVIGLPSVMVVSAQVAAIGLGELLIGAWVVASGILAVRWAIAALRLARLSGSWRPATFDGVPVWMTEGLGPAVVGTFRPRVLVPSWLGSLPRTQRSLVLLHEREHIRAHDPKLIALARVARVLAPWNPVVWFLSARLVRAVELDCDRRVLSQHGDVAAYGQTLLTVSERRPGRLVAPAAFAESEAPLRSRILAMTTPSRTISIVALLTSLVLGVVLMMGALEIPVPTESIRIARESASVEPTPADIQGRAVSVPVAGGANSRPRPADGGAPGDPRFTPYTVAPSILNRNEVVRALIREYPAALRNAGIGGTVRVYFYVDETGIVRATRIDESSGHQPLDDAALAVANVYRFTAALNRDQPTPVWISFPITFQVR